MANSNMNFDLYDLELIRSIAGLIEFKIKENSFEDYTFANDEISGHQDLLVQLLPPADSDETDKEFWDFSREIIGCMFTLSALSFEAAKPRGLSEADYRESTRWNIGDFLLRLEFRRNQLFAHFDYEHGRAMKTTLEADSINWTIRISTNDRGRSSEHWIRALNGKAKPKLLD